MSLRLLVFLLAVFPQALVAQGSWRPESQSVTRENLWGVGFSGSALVAVGERGTILRADYEGGTWQPRLSGTDVWLVGVGYGDNRWIAVGDLGTILLSTDGGETWAAQTSGTNIRLNNVVCGFDRWIAVGEQGTVLTSVDRGRTWTMRTIPNTGFLRALAYRDAQFLIGGAAGALYTTRDGTAFTRVPIATTADIEAAATSSSRFFVTGSRGLRATATTLGAWTIEPPVEADGTFRGLSVQWDDHATVASESAVWWSLGGRWYGSTFRPGFLVTSMTRAVDEAIAVGFGGAIARSSSLYGVEIVPGSANVTRQTEFDFHATYHTEVRLTAVPRGDVTDVAYQWEKDGVTIAGATSATLVLPAVKPEAAGKYLVRATSGGSILRVSFRILHVGPAGGAQSIDPTFACPLEREPSSVKVQPDGRILVIGRYIGDSHSLQSTIVRLNTNGSIDQTFRVDPGADITRAEVAPDGRIYVELRGALERQFATRVVRLLASGALDRDFQPDVSDSLHYTRLGPAGEVYVFSQNHRRSIRLRADGSRDITFNLPEGYAVIGVDDRGKPWATWGTSFVESMRFTATGLPDGRYRRWEGLPSWGAFAGGEAYGCDVAFVREKGVTYFSTAPGYQLPPTPSSAWSHIYLADGTLWQFQTEIPPFQVVARAFTPLGLPDPERALVLDDYRLRPIAAQADGALLMLRLYGPPPVLARVRPTVGRPGRLTNLSVRAFVTSAEAPLIAGFVTAGTGDTRAIVRAIGPALAPFGVTDAMPDPQLELVVESATVATNDRWPAELATQFTTLGAFPLPAGSEDAAVDAALGPGNHSAIVSPAPGTAGGTALIEVYESTPAASRQLINLSSRGPVGPGRPLIVGFSLTGEHATNLLLRGIGPTLAQLGVGDAVADTKLTLYRGDAALYENDNWSALNPTLTSSSAGTGAFRLVAASKDSALRVTLGPGSYTAVVESVGDSSGTALAEIYQVR